MKAKVLRPISCRRLVVVAASTIGAAMSANLSAQVTAMNPAIAPKPAYVVELSPFTVNETLDHGYAAQETLAGTRMRTNLADVGAALTVVTPLFLQDLAVNSFDQALIFTPSVDTFQGSNNTNGSELRYSDNQNYTIRGFIGSNGNQAISHDFFTALDTNDAYNIESITLSLGPNSMLIGVGNPQGVAVTTTKRARLDRQKTSVRAQIDRWSSNRVALDYNKPLIKGKLGFRLNLLHDQNRGFRHYEGMNQERGTLGLTYKPFDNTTVTLNHESYSVHRNIVPLSWAWDSQVLRWAVAGKPKVDFLPAGQTWSSTRAYVDANGKSIPVAAGVVNADGLVHARTDFDPNSVLNQITSNQLIWVNGLNLPNPMVNMRYQGQLTSPVFGGVGSVQTNDPWALTGIAKDTNLNSGTWDYPNQVEHGRWSTLTIEQKLAPGLYLEVSGNVARKPKTFDTTNYNIIQLDVNRYLPDGSSNPGYLVPFAQGGGQFRNLLSRLEQYRATLAYEIDLTKKNHWLGKHNFGALIQTDKTITDQDLQQVINVASVGLPTSGGWSGDATNGAGYLNLRAYFQNGNQPSSGLPGLRQAGKVIKQLESYGKFLGASANEAVPINLAVYNYIPATKTLFTDKAQSIGWQARWFGDRLVTVAGYRKDATKSYGGVTTRNVIDPDIPGASANSLLRFYAPSQSEALNTVPTVVTQGISRTYGAVYHAFSWLSLTYNRSANFSPVTTAGQVDPLGRPAPNSNGQTVDYGVRFSLLNHRISIGLNRFETSAENQVRNGFGFVSGAYSILQQLRKDFSSDSHFVGLPPFGSLPLDTANTIDTWNFKATGYELNVVFNPSRSWRVSLSGSSDTNILGDHIKAAGIYLATNSQFQGIQTWTTFANELQKVAAGQKSTYFDLDPTKPADKQLASQDGTLIQQQVTALQVNYANEKALEGITTTRNGKYGVNGLVTHVFSEQGLLKGWSLGGNFRWRSPSTVGYLLLSGSAVGLSDVSKPVKGDDYWDCGTMLSYERRLTNKINLRVQLNVDNVLNFNRARVVQVGYDTNGLYGTTNAVVPVRWEMRRPRNFVLTTTFDF